MVDAVGEPNCFSFLLELLVWHAIWEELNFPSQLFYGHPVENHRIWTISILSLVSVEKSFLRQVMTGDESDKLHTISKRQQQAAGSKYKDG